jgi:hypothetical protein
MVVYTENRILDTRPVLCIEDVNRRQTQSWTPIHGLSSEKWSSLMYGLWSDEGLDNAKEETRGGGDRRQAAAG